MADAIGTAAGVPPLSSPRFSVKPVALCVLHRTGVIRLAERLSHRKLPVLTYHRVIPREAVADRPRPPNTLFTDEFAAQMQFIARRYRVLGGEELRRILVSGSAIPNRCIVITFDDGYENNYSWALPILQRYGLRAVFFVTTDLIGSDDRLFWFDRLDRLLSVLAASDLCGRLRQQGVPLATESSAAIRSHLKKLSSARQDELLDDLEHRFGPPPQTNGDEIIFRPMSWDQVRALAAAGMTIGSHTCNHQILSAVPPPEARAEVLASRIKIEQEIGQACWLFGYPNGQPEDFRPEDEASLRDAGYQCAFTQISGVIDARALPFRLPRIPVPDTGDIRIFRSHVSGLQRLLKAS